VAGWPDSVTLAGTTLTVPFSRGGHTTLTVPAVTSPLVWTAFDVNDDGFPT
jgi:hypothetical protein